MFQMKLPDIASSSSYRFGELLAVIKVISRIRGCFMRSFRLLHSQHGNRDLPSGYSTFRFQKMLLKVVKATFTIECLNLE